MAEQKFKTEEFRVEGEKLIAKIKELIHEGTIRRIIIKDKEGKTVMEIPMTFGVVGEVAGCSIRAETDIETIFGNVDAGGLW